MATLVRTTLLDPTLGKSSVYVMAGAPRNVCRSRVEPLITTFSNNLHNRQATSWRLLPLILQRRYLRTWFWIHLLLKWMDYFGICLLGHLKVTLSSFYLILETDDPRYFLAFECSHLRAGIRKCKLSIGPCTKREELKSIINKLIIFCHISRW